MPTGRASITALGVRAGEPAAAWERVSSGALRAASLLERMWAASTLGLESGAGLRSRAGIASCEVAAPGRLAESRRGLAFAALSTGPTASEVGSVWAPMNAAGGSAAGAEAETPGADGADALADASGLIRRECRVPPSSCDSTAGRGWSVGARGSGESEGLPPNALASDSLAGKALAGKALAGVAAMLVGGAACGTAALAAPRAQRKTGVASLPAANEGNALEAGPPLEAGAGVPAATDPGAVGATKPGGSAGIASSDHPGSPDSERRSYADCHPRCASATTERKNPRWSRSVMAPLVLFNQRKVEVTTLPRQRQNFRVAPVIAKR